MRLGMMTLGCPGWDLETICRRGREFGFAGVDFRGLQGELDVTRLPAFTTGASQTRRMLADAGLETCGISTSLRVCDAGQAAANLDEAKRTIETARGLGAVNVPVFGGQRAEGVSHEDAAKVGAECVRRILELPGARELKWNFETHDDWIRAEHCKLLLDAIPDGAFGALWDMGHTWRVGRERPAETVKAIGSRIRYCHVKDAVYVPGQAGAMGDGWKYVLPGEGELPLAECVGLLRGLGYDGWLVFEHEKRWHADLPEPEVAFPAFVKWARGVVG